jgi:hypothetical protein
VNLLKLSYFYNENGSLRTVYKVLLGITVVVIIGGIIYYYYPFSGSGGGSSSGAGYDGGGSDSNAAIVDSSAKAEGSTSPKSSKASNASIISGSESDASTVKAGSSRRSVEPTRLASRESTGADARTVPDFSGSSSSTDRGKTSLAAIERLANEATRNAEEIFSNFKLQLQDILSSTKTTTHVRSTSDLTSKGYLERFSIAFFGETKPRIMSYKQVIYHEAQGLWNEPWVSIPGYKGADRRLILTAINSEEFSVSFVKPGTMLSDFSLEVDLSNNYKYSLVSSGLEDALNNFLPEKAREQSSPVLASASSSSSSSSARRFNTPSLPVPSGSRSTNTSQDPASIALHQNLQPLAPSLSNSSKPSTTLPSPILEEFGGQIKSAFERQAGQTTSDNLNLETRNLNSRSSFDWSPQAPVATEQKPLTPATDWGSRTPLRLLPPSSLSSNDFNAQSPVAENSGIDLVLTSATPGAATPTPTPTPNPTPVNTEPSFENEASVVYSSEDGSVSVAGGMVFSASHSDQMSNTAIEDSITILMRLIKNPSKRRRLVNYFDNSTSNSRPEWTVLPELIELPDSPETPSSPSTTVPNNTLED